MYMYIRGERHNPVRLNFLLRYSLHLIRYFCVAQPKLEVKLSFNPEHRLLNGIGYPSTHHAPS
jgi:hypothetical protein